MAGINPGMIIKVAADITEAVAALGNVVKATGDVEGSAKQTEKAYAALDVAIGTFAANAASALFSLAFDAVKALGEQLWGVVDAALGASKQFDAFKASISDALRESGVLQRMLDSLGTSLLTAFGTTKEQAVERIARLIETGARWTLEFAADLITLGEYGVRGLAALLVPVDAVLFALADMGGRLADINLFLAETATKVPGIGGQFVGLAANAKTVSDTFKGWKDEAYNTLKSHQDLVSGSSEFLTWTGTAKTALREAAASHTAVATEAGAAAKGIAAVTEANTGLVLGTGEAVVALYSQAKALEDMDTWSRAIKNTDPYAYLAMGMTKTLPPLETTTKALEATSKAAIDMSADVRFAAETVETAAATVQTAALSWSAAMELVRKGQGTMTGTIGKPVKPDTMSESEWNLMQTNPTAWQAQHGYDWDSPHAGTANAWMMGGSATSGGTTVNQSVTVNTVAGDKQAIAAVVKDALAADWRSSGVRA